MRADINREIYFEMQASAAQRGIRLSTDNLVITIVRIGGR